VLPVARPEFGDYQVNGIMAAAKMVGTRPRDMAAKVVSAADVSDLAEKVEIAGPGFINVTIAGGHLARLASRALADEKLGVAPPARQTVVVDYSCPNLAKEMHVGHLRGTVIGDALARVLDFLGHRVIRQNHVGDWGTQFGMLIAYFQREQGRSPVELRHELADLEEFYRRAKQLFDTDPRFADESRQTVVRLQGGDEACLAIWRQFIAESLKHCQAVYDRLNVTLAPEHVRGESAYNDDLPRVVADLDAAGLLTESRGAKCVFLDEFKGKDGQPLPMIVRKSDGGYLYATTDLAAVRHRAGVLHADRILYMTDARQTLHFRQMFAVARAAGFADEHVRLEHLPNGTVQGPDGKPFRTRDGGTVKLMDLLDEAVERAGALVAEKNPDLPAGDRANIARVVGIGAVKYADLAHNRASDYVFSWDKMLSLDGNTAPYMQYAYARIRSIFRKTSDSPGEIAIAEPAERALAVKLAQFPEAVETVAADGLPNLMCGYLYELAGRFMGFYEQCPVLQSDQPVRSSRLALCELTARTVRTGLDLLGIETVEQM
jgi:arginyl-tRNA synthetase